TLTTTATKEHPPLNPTIGIIGGGAAGLFAALHAARTTCEVILWEANPTLGRKLAVTGGGRGNLSHRGLGADRYACDAPESLHALLHRFNHDWLRRELLEQGVLTYCSDDGWCYPVSHSAAAVSAILATAVAQHHVMVSTGCRITAVKKIGDGFMVRDDLGGGRTVQRLIVATGGKAHPQLGGDDDALAWLAELGVTVRPMRPALAPLIAEVRALHKLQGVRLDVAAELYGNGLLLGRSTGNLIFTQFGLNGPAAMDLSHLVHASPLQPMQLLLNFLPHHLDAFMTLVRQKRKQGWPLQALLESALPAKLAALIARGIGAPLDQDVAALTEEQSSRLVSLLTAFPIAVIGVKGFHHAQLAAGGVPLSEIDTATMECRGVQGLFLAGEVLDVVGPCGGFNLHFAFASGALAGIGAGRL
ncbi:MAG TPA: aminoacetone oxidase family FAD-binding enzyme, partial [bacterium]|nr:aminoacetone oxidase family FAD-binding enzyme [bacterium]